MQMRGTTEWCADGPRLCFPDARHSMGQEMWVWEGLIADWQVLCTLQGAGQRSSVYIKGSTFVGGSVLSCNSGWETHSQKLVVYTMGNRVEIVGNGDVCLYNMCHTCIMGYFTYMLCFICILNVLICNI